MDQKTEFAERLKQAMLAKGYKVRAAVLEREFNTRYWGRAVTFQAVSAWLKGKSIPAQDKLEVLAEWLEVEPQVLRFGEGVVKAVRDKQQRWEEGITAENRELFETFLRLPVPQRKEIRNIIETYAKAYLSQTSVDAPADP